MVAKMPSILLAGPGSNQRTVLQRVSNESVDRAQFAMGAWAWDGQSIWWKLHEDRSAMKEIVIALAGNPDVGKSAVFNALTGANQRVGNWPGKTIEKRAGTFRMVGATPAPGLYLPVDPLVHSRQTITIVDLPGTYSLSAYSPEEEVARDFIVEEHPHLVINVVDASHIERNLYLTAQLLETGVPLIVVLNMQDQAAANGIRVDAAGCPVSWATRLSSNW